MSLQRRLSAGLVVGSMGLAFTTAAHAADPPTITVNPQALDAGADATRGNNLVWLTSDPAHRVRKLLVFLPLGGVPNLPTEFEELGSEAGRLGYHAIVLPYKNEVAIANATACGNEIDQLPSSPEDCAINARRELQTGANTSPVITVNVANSIDNRLNKLLQHLKATRPAAEGWAQFVDADGQPNWADTVIAGASLGAGQAALMASLHPVHRVALFTGWTDAQHLEHLDGGLTRPWVRIGATPADRYFSLVHARDVFYARTCPAYATFQMAQACPLLDPTDPRLIDKRRPPYGTRELVFNLEPDPAAASQPNGGHHPSPVRDPFMPKAADGVTPSPILVDAWRATLGDADADTFLDEVDNCPTVANPSQADTDHNGNGDACPTGVVGGSVPATLSLKLGPAATFGAFTPGIARVYEASTTAHVISTAGDAILSSADPGRLTNATFALPEPLQVSFSKAAWAGPVSNDAVTIAFKQPIKATDALRTGVYSRTLTFTLSTTSP